MKKVLLLIISLLFAQSAFAYQTVLVDFPENQGWHDVYYANQGSESILQYVPAGQDEQNWTKTVIFHSYKSLSWTNSAAGLMDRLTGQMEKQNSTQLYRYTKYKEMDSIAVRCVKKNAIIPAQGEIFRVAKSFDGLITMHYINKNIADYKSTYSTWYEIMRNIRIYYSYYREDRVLDKATSFEL